MLQHLKAPKLPFGELDSLVKAIGECRSKQEEDRIIAAEVDTLKQRLSDPKLDKARGREYMVRVIYCEMLGHDASFAYIPALQLASDPNLLTKKAAYLALTQLLDYKHELVLLLVNTLLSDLKSDNFVVVASALVATTKLIGPDLINAVLPLVVERLSHPREAVRKKAVMALHHFYQMDPQRTGPLAGVELERHFRITLCDKEPSVMAATLNALMSMAAANPAPFRQLIPSLTSILKQVVEHRLPKAYDYHRFPAPFIQIKLLKLLRLLGMGDKAASDNMSAVVASTLRRAAAGGSHTIGHAIVYEAVRTITEIYPNPQLLASAAEAVAGLLKSSSHNLKYCGLTALAAITRVSPKYAQEHQVAVIDCLEDLDETLKLKTLELLVTMTKSNNVQVVVDRLMAFLRSTACGGDELLRRHIAGQIVDLAEKYAPDTTWFVGVMAEVFEVGGDVLQPQLAHNLCRLVAEQDSELHNTAVKMFMDILDQGATAATSAGGAAAAAAAGSSSKPGALPEILLCCICWVLGEYGSLAGVPQAQVMDKLCAAVMSAQPSPTTRAYLISAITKLAARQLLAADGSGTRSSVLLRPDAEDLLHKAESSSLVELQQRAHEAAALLKLPAVTLAAVLPFDASCEELEQAELEEAKNLTFLDGFVNEALANGAKPYTPPPELTQELGIADDDLENLGLPGSSSSHRHGKHPHSLRFNAYEPAAAPRAATAAAATGGSFGSSSSSFAQAALAVTPVAAAAAAQGQSGSPAGGYHHQQQQQPQLVLKGASRGRWGPTEFGSSSSSSSSAPPAAAAAAAAAAPVVGSVSSSAKPTASSSSRQQQLSAEKSRLAASLFGSGGETQTSSSSSRFGTKGAAATAARPATPPAAHVDLLGEDVTAPTTKSGSDGGAPAAAAAAATATAPKSDLDLLLDLDDVAPVAVPAAAPAAAAASPLDLLSGSTAAAATPGAASGGSAGGNLLDLDGLFSATAPAGVHGAAAAQPQQQQHGLGATVPAAGVGSGLGDLDSLGLMGGSIPGCSAAVAGSSVMQQQQQQQQQPVAGVGVKPASGAAMRGGQPAKGSSIVDPFKDLLG